MSMNVRSKTLLHFGMPQNVPLVRPTQPSLTMFGLLPVANLVQSNEWGPTELATVSDALIFACRAGQGEPIGSYMHHVTVNGQADGTVRPSPAPAWAVHSAM